MNDWNAEYNEHNNKQTTYTRRWYIQKNGFNDYPTKKHLSQIKKWLRKGTTVSEEVKQLFWNLLLT